MGYKNLTFSMMSENSYFVQNCSMERFHIIKIIVFRCISTVPLDGCGFPSAYMTEIFVNTA